jgi:hypothetical protein
MRWGKNSVSPLKEQNHRSAEKRPSFSGTARKKLGLSPGRTEPSLSREETEFFRCGGGKNSVSPLREQSHRLAEKRPSFSGAVVKKLGLSPERIEPSLSREETEFFGCGAEKTRSLP